MKKLAALPFCLGCVFAVSNTHAIDLKQSKVTQVVNDVQIISAADQQQKNASVNDIFSMPDILRTGAASRAELIAADETVTRVGANTIFSFDPASRTINLKQGSLLFHSPHGKGGGTIHTGSATASVLGTTLIVTTTPSGGMKVLDLEGSVEVKFLNGLKQTLAPGRMTFVLPGGNQLAPIIVYRLDDLTKNSLLVGGFNQNLSSMPLIQQQIDKQLKAIQSGKLTDTGLEVGDDANSKQVQVLDPQLLQTALDQAFINSGEVTAALAVDATINAPALDSAGIPTPPKRIFLDEPILLPGNNHYTGQVFEGFAANNLSFNISHPLTPLGVNLSPYASAPEFDFVAMGNLTVAGSVDFVGLSPSDNLTLSLVAGKQTYVAPGAIINANVAIFNWQSAGTLTLDGAGVHNTRGNTTFASGADFVAQNGTLVDTLGSLTVLTAGNIAINHSTVGGNSVFLTSGNGDLTVDSSRLNVDNSGFLKAKQNITLQNSSVVADETTGFVKFEAESGSVNITGTSFQTQYLTVNSGDGILLDGTGQSFVTSGSGSLANFTAANKAEFNNANLTSFSSVNIAANTINLHNVSFGNGLVSLKSFYGMWHNGSSSFGYVNDLGGNTYNGQSISAADGFHGTIAGTGITVSTR